MSRHRRIVTLSAEFWTAVALRLIAAAALTVTGYVHQDLWGKGYRYVAFVGPGFLAMSAAAFALAAVILVGAPWTTHVIGAGLAASTLVGFVMSRTSGIAGFTEIGWQPSPDAAESVIADVIAFLACAAYAWGFGLRHILRSFLERRSATQSS